MGRGGDRRAQQQRVVADLAGSNKLVHIVTTITMHACLSDGSIVVVASQSYASKCDTGKRTALPAQPAIPHLVMCGWKEVPPFPLAPEKKPKLVPP